MKHEMFSPKGTVEGWRWCDWVTAEPDWFCISLALILLVNLFRTDSQFSNLMENKWPNLTLGYPTQLLKVWESEGIENTEIVQAGCVLLEWEQRHRVKWSGKKKKKILPASSRLVSIFLPNVSSRWRYSRTLPRSKATSVLTELSGVFHLSHQAGKVRHKKREGNSQRVFFFFFNQFQLNLLIGGQREKNTHKPRHGLVATFLDAGEMSKTLLSVVLFETLMAEVTASAWDEISRVAVSLKVEPLKSHVLRRQNFNIKYHISSNENMWWVLMMSKYGLLKVFTVLLFCVGVILCVHNWLFHEYTLGYYSNPCNIYM